MAKKKVQAVSFEDLKALVVNEAKQNGNVLTQEQIDEYLMNYDLSDELAEELLEYIQVILLRVHHLNHNSLNIHQFVLGLIHSHFVSLHLQLKPLSLQMKQLVLFSLPYLTPSLLN